MNNNKPFYLENRSAVHKLTFGLPGSGISSVMEKEITTMPIIPRMITLLLLILMADNL